MMSLRVSLSRLIRVAAAVAALTMPPMASRAQDDPEPLQTPFLMVDTAMHVGPIWRVAVDASGSLLATAAGDRSIRLFDLASGDLLRKIHLPLGDGEIGAPIAVALSPDGGRLLAATLSFDTGTAFDSGSVYVVDVQAGTILGRLRNLPAVPTRMAFAPDGRHFALVMEDAGVQLRTARGRCVWQDANPLRVEPIGSAAFAADGRLATLSRTGLLRVYAIAKDTETALGERRDCPQADEDAVADANVERRYQRRMPAELGAAGIAFSPGGDQLVVGYRAAAVVDVVDIATDQVRQLQPPPELSDGNLSAVAWGRGSEPRLFAGGTVQNHEQRNVLVAWPPSNGATAVALPVSEDSITDLAALPGGGVVVASTDPTWSRVGTDPSAGGLVIDRTRPGERLDFREVSSRRFAVDGTGTVVEFAGRGRQDSVFRFDLASLTLEEVGDGHADLATAAAARAGRTLEAAFPTNTPRLDGQPLWLRDGERALAADIASSGDRVILGTDHRLRLYDSAGSELAVRDTPTAAWGVVMVPDRPLAVVAHGDGSIRWYSLRKDLPLAEIAGLFVHRDGRRWVAWTADGFFAHSDYGGEALVGFQQNGSRSAPTGQWLSFQQGYRLLYDPARVSAVLGRQAEWQQIADRSRVRERLAALALPKLTLEAYCPLDTPSADLATRGLAMLDAPPADPAACQPIDAATLGLAARSGEPPGIELPAGTAAVRIRLRVEGQGGGVGPIDAFVDGRNAGRVNPDPASAPTDGVLTVEREIQLAAGEARLVFRAYDRSGVFSQSPPLRISLEPPLVPQAPPRLYLIAVGIDRYGPAIGDLKLAVADARTFVDVAGRLAPELYGKVTTQTLFDGEATRAAIVERIEELARHARPEDGVVLYLAGHGIADDEGRYVFVTHGTTSAQTAPAEGLDNATLIEALAELQARNVFLLLDTCYAGGFAPQGPGNLGNESGLFVLTGSSSVEEALDSYDGQNGVFGYAVKEGLLGGANASGDVNALDLASHVTKAVPILARQRDHSQSATFKMAGNYTNFLIATVPQPAAGPTVSAE